jgi:hypothetical protein
LRQWVLSQPCWKAESHISWCRHAKERERERRVWTPYGREDIEGDLSADRELEVPTGKSLLELLHHLLPDLVLLVDERTFIGISAIR